MLLLSIAVFSIVCISVSCARISTARFISRDKSEGHSKDFQDGNPERHFEFSIVCSEFKGRAVLQQCSGVQTLDRLGSYDDRVACGEACKRAASEARKATCCIFTVLDHCVAYVGSDHVLDGRLKANTTSGEISFRGSATVCRPIPRIGGKVSEAVDQWEFAEGGKPGRLKQLFSLLSAKKTRMYSGHGEALFRHIKPSEIKQGNLGDCWLMAVIGAMARFPGAISKLFLEQFRTTDGKYNVRLYSPVQSRWIWVSIDDSVPSSLFSDPMFAQLAANRAMWVLLLEKAVAKFVDPREDLDGRDRSKGFSKLNVGFAEFAMTFLTGAQKIDLWRRTKKTTTSDSLVILKAPQVDFARDSLKQQFPSVAYHSGATTEKEIVNNSWKAWLVGETSVRRSEFKRFTIDDAWEALLRGTKENRLMSGSIAKTSSSLRETEEGDGLYGGHTYSILQAKEISASNRVCVETITVTYASKKDWDADAGFMKRAWWLHGEDSKRFIGATWRTSRAVRYGVEEGWSLVHPTAFDAPGPTKFAMREVTFKGVVDDFACDTYERHRSGRQTEVIQMPLATLSLGESVRLLQVRNPWGSEEKWTGTWSDTDTKTWTKQWDVANVVGFAPLPDGIWWMTLEDFIKKFSCWSIGSVDMLSFSPGVSNGDCADGFLGKFAWNGSVAVAEGPCTPAPCNIIGTTGDGPHCRCIAGLSGDISWNGPTASGTCLADASALFNEGSEKFWLHNGMKITCCESDIGLPTRLQDVNSPKLPSINRGGMTMFSKTKACGRMFGDTYHNGMQKAQPSCRVSVTHLMETLGEGFETVKAMLLT